MKSKKERGTQPKFESALARLEKIVTDLEKGDLPLEDALKRFEEGVHLSKSCLKVLEEAEQKVEILLEDKGGAKRAVPFDDIRGEAVEEEERE
jgi:exodeoxyribonuclease VII small subunit